MGLLGDIQAEARPNRPVCSVSVLLADLDEADRSDLLAAFSDAKIPHSAIARVLNTRGHHIAAQTIARHRSRGCSCG